eukprot:scaffold241562_cov17-Prasinocladus_malaysianus.AAC.1
MANYSMLISFLEAVNQQHIRAEQSNLASEQRKVRLADNNDLCTVTGKGHSCQDSGYFSEYSRAVL